MEGKSERYRKAESVCAAFLFVMFCLWCPTYLIVIRPVINVKLASYISAYPAVLHLIPIFAPIVFVALIVTPFMPPKNDGAAVNESISTRKEG